MEWKDGFTFERDNWSLYIIRNVGIGLIMRTMIELINR